VALTQGIIPLLQPCDDAGGAALPRHFGTDALVPEWTPAAWTANHLVRAQQTPGGAWTLYLAIADHQANQQSPATGAPGWVALTPTVTTIPLWQAGQAYGVGAPVRIDTAQGLTRLFMTSAAITASQNSPDTPAGVAEGWHEISVTAPPPALPFDPAKAYRNGDMAADASNRVWVATGAIAAAATGPGAPGASNLWVEVAHEPTVTTTVDTSPAGSPAGSPPANPRLGDRFVNTFYNVEWVYADDPTVAGTQLVWLRTHQAMFHTNGSVTLSGGGGARTAAFNGTHTEPNPATIVPEDGDVIFEHDPTTDQLLRVLYL